MFEGHLGNYVCLVTSDARDVARQTYHSGSIRTGGDPFSLSRLSVPFMGRRVCEGVANE